MLFWSEPILSHHLDVDDSRNIGIRRRYTYLTLYCFQLTSSCFFKAKKQFFKFPMLPPPLKFGVYLSEPFCQRLSVLFYNKSELYLHDYNNTALQKRGKQDDYSNLNIRVQLQH